jgi:hypothetical protein
MRSKAEPTTAFPDLDLYLPRPGRHWPVGLERIGRLVSIAATVVLASIVLGRR